ncbi:ATP-dependent DNA helicase [Candidatus Omnitrophota bacterium]
MPKNDTNITSLRRLFEEGGKVASNLQNYETRPQQLDMVQAVEEAIEGEKNLIVEAGPGVGKSLAYLVPFISWAVKNNKKAVISTYTKALQNQLYVKDLPFLSRALDEEFRYSLCMGSENYICLRKSGKHHARDLFESKKRRSEFDKIKKWIPKTETGLVTDMDFVPDRTVWAEFSRESDLCLGKKCSHFHGCFYMNARREQADAHVLVTNHAMLFTDMMSEAQVLPDFQGLVLDEAHTLEDVATRHFGSTASNAGFIRIFERIDPLISGKLEEVISQGEVWDKKTNVQKNLDGVKALADEFFNSVGDIYGQEGGTFEFDHSQFQTIDLEEGLKELAKSLDELGDTFTDDEEAELAKACADRCDRMCESLKFLFDTPDSRYVYWLEVDSRRKGVNYSFHSSPIDISGQMRTHLFDRVTPVVLTSATLSVSSKESDLSFIEKRLGVDDALELVLDSPFDYAKNVLMYLPKGIPDPAKEVKSYKDNITDHIISMHDVMGGRMFALFTSYSMLNAAADEISRRREDINILKQGDLPRYVLLDVFKKNNDSILLGTSTFWQGVDVPGSPLECVIITKLPFSVPTDPVNAARIKSMREEGFNPFNEYQLPQAIIMFKQGFGRLIRSCSDRGVVVVLDPRLRTRAYGRKFIEALPGCPRTDNLEDVRDFFEPAS